METLELHLITLEAAIKGCLNVGESFSLLGAEPGCPAALSTKNVHFKNQRKQKLRGQGSVTDSTTHRRTLGPFRPVSDDKSCLRAPEADKLPAKVIRATVNCFYKNRTHLCFSSSTLLQFNCPLSEFFLDCMC